MTRLSAAAAVVGLVVSGIVVGVMATHLYYSARWRAGGPRMMSPGLYTLRLERHLDLSQDQVEAIDEVISRSRDEAAELRHEMWPRVRTLMDETLAEIELVLTPEQREDYQRLRRFQRRRLEMFVLGPGGPGHSPGGPGGPPRRRLRGDRP